MEHPSSDRNRHDVLGVNFDLISYEAALATIERWRIDGGPHYVTLLNPHCVTLCRRDARMAEATAKADLTLPDGVGIILAAQFLGYPHKGRVTGPTLMLKLCERGRDYGYRHYFYGGADGVANLLAARLCTMYPGLQVAGAYGPPFRAVTQQQEDESIVQKINSTRPDIVWVGLGAPKQEIWMSEHVGRIAATAMIGVGAAFDYHAGVAKWAPAWVRFLGLEWLYCAVNRPRRGMKKLPGTVVFAAHLPSVCIHQKLRAIDR